MVSVSLPGPAVLCYSLGQVAHSDYRLLDPPAPDPGRTVDPLACAPLLYSPCFGLRHKTQASLSFQLRSCGGSPPPLRPRSQAAARALPTAFGNPAKSYWARSRPRQRNVSPPFSGPPSSRLGHSTEIESWAQRT